MTLFDSHFHYYREKDGEPAGYYARAEAAGVQYLLAAGAGYKESLDAAFFASEIEKAYFAAGVHPHEAAKFGSSTAIFDEFRNHPKLVAVGEIGLDYFYEISERALQMATFEKFIETALEWKLPAIIHCRDKEGSDQSYQDAFSILKDFSADKGRFVVHCYSGTPGWADKFMELGAFLGVTGMITFKKSANIRELLKIIPDERLLIETDSPYLAPVPHRGKDNHPEYLSEIARCAAAEKGLSFERLAEITTANAMELFVGKKAEQ